MEVTRGNFSNLLPYIEEAIKKSSFITIDGEFTGLKVGKDVNSFDTPEEYYKTISTGSCNFMLVQFGVCAFRWDAAAKHYKHSAFNFYLFPRPYARHAPDRVFYCQSSSIEFLATQGFDFNKLFVDGISYLSAPQETKLKEMIEERQKLYALNAQSNVVKDIIDIPPENKEYIEDICKRVSAFLEDPDRNCLELDRTNAFQRKLIYQEVSERFPDKAILETKILENKDRMLVITKASSKEDLLQKEKEKNEKEFTDLNEAIGFTRVARLLSESGKLIIGHNMILDLLHTLNHFFAPLPEKYKEFKEFAGCMFPKIIDTKYMSTSQPFRDKLTSTTLSPLLASLAEEPFGIPETVPECGENLIGYSETKEKFHEAGYDAFITGLCFLAMYKHLLSTRGGEMHESPVQPESILLKPYLNKLYLFKTAYHESPYMNLAGNDPKPSRDHVFHVTFPKEWTRTELNQLFSPHGNIHISYLDDTSAYVGLLRRDQSGLVMRSIRPSKLYKITPYKVHKKQPAGASLPSYNQLRWKANNNDSQKLVNVSPEKKRKIETEQSAPTDRVSKSNNAQQPNDDAPSAPKRTPSQKSTGAKTVSNETTSKYASSLAQASRKRERRTSSSTFTVEDQSPVSTRVHKSSEGEPHRAPVRTAAMRKQESEKLSGESKKWKEIADAFKESDNWD